jgi:hypothetical protein
MSLLKQHDVPLEQEPTEDRPTDVPSGNAKLVGLASRLHGGGDLGQGLVAAKLTPRAPRPLAIDYREPASKAPREIEPHKRAEPRQGPHRTVAWPLAKPVK